MKALFKTHAGDLHLHVVSRTPDSLVTLADEKGVVQVVDCPISKEPAIGHAFLFEEAQTTGSLEEELKLAIAEVGKLRGLNEDGVKELDHVKGLLKIATDDLAALKAENEKLLKKVEELEKTAKAGATKAGKAAS